MCICKHEIHSSYARKAVQTSIFSQLQQRGVLSCSCKGQYFCPQNGWALYSIKPVLFVGICNKNQTRKKGFLQMLFQRHANPKISSSTSANSSSTKKKKSYKLKADVTLWVMKLLVAQLVVWICT